MIFLALIPLAAVCVFAVGCAVGYIDGFRDATNRFTSSRPADVSL